MTTPKFARGTLHTFQPPEQVSKVTRALHGVGRKVALVPTMGALHAGHRELIRRAKRLPNTVVATSIFVNPLQFGEGEDFEAYPRPLDKDLEVLKEDGVELGFLPKASDLYPDGATVTVHPGPLGDELEGAVRPGHFAGVLTVVAKLFNIVRPDYAFFGEKDYQQLVLIKKMVRDLNFDTRVIGVPTVRERDGLALSSRNVYLTPEQREDAIVLSAALTAGAFVGRDGAEAVLATARKTLAARPAVEVDYLELRGTDLGPAPVDGEARLLIAARVGSTRLIDNVPVVLGAAADHPEHALDAGE
ncbi:pantoate--beta-alanine ligase [Amycolatopsis regifaucium]|uniref:Pantothenate synthetase n=1 Tax=Amycolatopsis regifaucium TaxID=546365 RepID=A0A154MH40_9PSEU|nr:pantoate--beta-alanine ligase [Amycolatopsis regifaucium]KZB83347.1 pantoate--beta-alanine ligase [Amycolatopsis regifaucium]OKA08813.1 pantoate--beta-alanine ligase [Amycolatopsis regifaucium]SFI93758.1 pantothenate synthetase [Amycolatopsis regifaucium]